MECGDNGFAVVWGESAPKVNVKPKHIVATLDLDNLQLLDQFETATHIYSAGLDAKSLYVCCQPEMQTEPVAGQGTAILARYDMESKAMTGSVASIHFDELKTLGNRYLVGISHSGPTQRYSLPNLDEIQEENEGASLLTGRLSGDSAMWDGVLRDRETWAAQLLCKPLHMPTKNLNTKTLKLKDGSIGYAEFGPHVFQWLPKGQPALKGLVSDEDEPNEAQQWLGYHCGWISINNGTLKAGGLSDYLSPDFRKRIDSRFLFPPKPGKRISHLASSKSMVFAITDSTLFCIPIDSLFLGQESFSFIEKQSRFVLAFGEANSLEYSAPNAIYYRLSLFAANEENSKPILQMESKSGKFEVKLSDRTLFRKLAINESDPAIHTSRASPDLEAIRRHVAQVNPAITELSGKRPTGISVPIKAIVVAEHKDGVQRAGMVHYFYVDVPGKLIRNPD